MDASAAAASVAAIDVLATREKEKQQMRVSVVMVENPGVVERDTASGRVPICNAVVQQGAVRVRCAFWREQAVAGHVGDCSGPVLAALSGFDRKARRGELGAWQLARHFHSTVS